MVHELQEVDSRHREMNGGNTAGRRRPRPIELLPRRTSQRTSPTTRLDGQTVEAIQQTSGGLLPIPQVTTPMESRTGETPRRAASRSPRTGQTTQRTGQAKQRTGKKNPI